MAQSLLATHSVVRAAANFIVQFQVFCRLHGISGLALRLYGTGARLPTAVGPFRLCADSPVDEAADEIESVALRFPGWFESAGAVEVGSADSLLSVLKRFSQMTLLENSSTGKESSITRKKLLLLVAAGQSESQSGGIGYGGAYVSCSKVCAFRGRATIS